MDARVRWWRHVRRKPGTATQMFRSATGRAAARPDCPAVPETPDKDWQGKLEAQAKMLKAKPRARRRENVFYDENVFSQKGNWSRKPM
jgi:hypothetical protein